MSKSVTSLRVLLVHPQDSLRAGPWCKLKWDLVVDLGRSSQASEGVWRELAGCPVLRLEAFRHPIEDARAAGEILRAGQGLLLDSQGIDWWELTGLFVHAEIETAIVLRRLVTEERFPAALFATRRDWPVDAFAHLANASIESFGTDAGPRSRILHYGKVLRRLRAGQIADIAFDKYDSGYVLRAMASAPRARTHAPQVLVPSAYTNVSRMASAYAQLLPEQKFLLVATRRNGLEFDRPANVRTAKLAAYASRTWKETPEQAALQQSWFTLLSRLKTIPEMETLASRSILDQFPRWLRNGLRVRDAWNLVLDREAISAVLCGDDSNWYTRLPVVIAHHRGLPTVDFHHGAFEGRYLLKSLPSDVYLAKSAAERDYLVSVCGLADERILLGAPPEPAAPLPASQPSKRSRTIVYFSEPYEASGARPEEIYRELVPLLCRVAAEHGTSVLIQLHPFESATERIRLVARVLPREYRPLAKVVSGPLTPDFLKQTWFGLTVESTTVADCARAGVPCFLCGWLVLSPYGQQYARFGIGQMLSSATEILTIPEHLGHKPSIAHRAAQAKELTPEMLRRVLTQAGHAQRLAVR